jgi:hypothetical protein
MARRRVGYIVVVRPSGTLYIAWPLHCVDSILFVTWVKARDRRCALGEDEGPNALVFGVRVLRRYPSETGRSFPVLLSNFWLVCVIHYLIARLAYTFRSRLLWFCYLVGGRWRR